MAKRKMMKWLEGFSKGLLVAGGLTWGLIGIANLNLINLVIGTGDFSTAVYIAIGLSAIYQAYNWLIK